METFTVHQRAKILSYHRAHAGRGPIAGRRHEGSTSHGNVMVGGGTPKGTFTSRWWVDLQSVYNHTLDGVAYPLSSGKEGDDTVSRKKHRRKDLGRSIKYFGDIGATRHICNTMRSTVDVEP